MLYIFYSDFITYIIINHHELYELTTQCDDEIILLNRPPFVRYSVRTIVER